MARRPSYLLYSNTKGLRRYCSLRHLARCHWAGAAILDIQDIWKVALSSRKKARGASNSVRHCRGLKNSDEERGRNPSAPEERRVGPSERMLSGAWRRGLAPAAPVQSAGANEYASGACTN